MKVPHSGQNCSSAATSAPQCLQIWESTSLLRRYCATGMGVFAVRTYEPWTIGSALWGLFLLAVFVALLILALSKRNR